MLPTKVPADNSASACKVEFAATRRLLKTRFERLRPVFELVADPREYVRAPEHHGACLSRVRSDLLFETPDSVSTFPATILILSFW
jgi:hypothetical protein